MIECFYMKETIYMIGVLGLAIEVVFLYQLKILRRMKKLSEVREK